MAFPANIRWNRYENFEDVKLENKFAPCHLTIPLINDAAEAVPQVSKLTKKMLRTSFFKPGFCFL